MTNTTARALAILTLVGVSSGCRPPEAPSELEDLTSYLFANVRNEDLEYLEVGVVAMDEWLAKNIEKTMEDGYSINNLDQETIDALDDNDYSLEGLTGAAVGGEFTHPVEDVIEALVADSGTEMYEAFSVYDRDYQTDLDCFLSEECDWLAINITSTSDYALGLEVTVNFNAEYRRVETDIGTAVVQRTWLTEPAEVSFDWLGVPSQYFLGVFLPDGKGSRRLQATWVATEIGDDGDVPEGTALSLVVGSMQSSDEDIQVWLDNK